MLHVTDIEAKERPEELLAAAMRRETVETPSTELGRRLIEQLRGTATGSSMSTDEIMALTRDVECT